MMTRNKKDGNFQTELVNIDDLVPENHILRIIEREFEFDFIYDYVEELYSSLGRPSIDPVVLFKCHFLKVYYGLSSLRRVYEDIKYHTLYKWFLGYGINEKTPNYSTYSQNYNRKFKKLEEDLLETFFYKVLLLLEEKGVLDLSNIFIDATHTKANANKKKVTKQMVNIIASEYKEELEAEINTRKQLIKEEDVPDVEVNDIECNHELKVEEVVETKEILKSTTDPEAGILYKDEKEKMVAYNTSIIGDNNNYVLAYDTNPSNMHDSKTFYPTYKKFKERFGVEKTDYMAGDAAYITTHICKTVVEDDIFLCLPYKRPQTKKGYFKKHEYVYDEANDIYICPNNCDLIPISIDKNGYIKYVASRSDCSKCIYKDKCTACGAKTVTRHVWEEHKEKVMNDYRHRQDCIEVYKSRPEHVERIFADGKGKNGLRCTLFRGNRRVSSEIGLIFGCMNLKKYAMHIKTATERDSVLGDLGDIMVNFQKFYYKMKKGTRNTISKIPFVNSLKLLIQ